MMKIIIAVCWSGGRVKSFIFSFFFIGRMNEKRRNNEISRRVLWEFYFTGLPRLLLFDVCFRGCYRVEGSKIIKSKMAIRRFEMLCNLELKISRETFLGLVTAEGLKRDLFQHAIPNGVYIEMRFLDLDSLAHNFIAVL